MNELNNSDNEPFIPASTTLSELTIKAIILSILLAIVLSAANAYLALKIGTTISASIPASVFALGILRLFKQHNVLECNLAQTAASAGEGVAAAIAFVLPAMIFLHIWKGFSYGETTIITLLGGLLGVLFSIPLRRIMLHLPALRFPEATAIGNILKASTQGEAGLKLLAQGGLLGGLIAFAQTALNIIADNLQLWVYAGRTVFGFALGLTPSTLAAGYIVGFEVAVSLLTGAIVGWLIILPFIGIYYGLPTHITSAYNAATQLWDAHLRFVGVGTMLVGGVWTLLKLLKPIAKGIHLSFVSIGFRKNLVGTTAIKPLRTEADAPSIWIFPSMLVLACLLFFYIFHYFHSVILTTSDYLWFVTLISVIFVLVIGFLLATISSYFCGLVGSSNNPLSGLLITAILLLAFLFLLLFHTNISLNTRYITSAVIIIATILACIGSITGESMQDLKAGQILGATPWRQQLMMALGVSVSALVIGPVLQLLFNAYGIGGIYPRQGMDSSKMLAAPQSGLMAAVTQGVLMQHLNWRMIVLGGLVAIIIIEIDEFLKRRNFRLPALAVGLGIYLPPEIITPVVIGGLVSSLVKKPWQKRNQTIEQRKAVIKYHQRGILMACGMVAGSALMGVILAIPLAIIGSVNILSIEGTRFVPITTIFGLIMFLALCFWFYRVGRKS